MKTSLGRKICRLLHLSRLLSFFSGIFQAVTRLLILLFQQWGCFLNDCFFQLLLQSNVLVQWQVKPSKQWGWEESRMLTSKIWNMDLVTPDPVWFVHIFLIFGMLYNCYQERTFLQGSDKDMHRRQPDIQRLQFLDLNMEVLHFLLSALLHHCFLVEQMLQNKLQFLDPC